MCEYHDIPSAQLLKRSFAASCEAFAASPDRKRFERVRELAHREMLEGLGMHERVNRAPNTESTMLDSRWEADEFQVFVLNRIASRIAVRLQEAAVTNEEVLSLPDPSEVLVLRVDEVFSAMNKMFPQGDTVRRRLEAEAAAHPGWPQEWIASRLTAVGALVPSKGKEPDPRLEFSGSWSGWGTAPGLELVVIERDGSGFLDFGAEGRQHFPALPEPAQRPSNPYGEHEDWHLEEWDEDFALDGEGMFALAAGRYRSRRNPKRK